MSQRIALLAAGALVLASSAPAVAFDGVPGRLDVSGRVDVDVAAAGRDVESDPLAGEAELRRARLGLRWRDDRLQGLLLVDGADGEAEVLDAWLRLRLDDVGPLNARVQFGRQREAVGLDELTSSDRLLLQERAMAMALAPGYSNGLSATAWNRDWTLTVGAFDERWFDSGEGEQSLTARGLRRWRFDDALLHVGLSASLRRPSDERLRFRVPAETAFDGAPRLRSPTFEGIGRYATFGAEALWLDGPLAIQGEWLRSEANDGPTGAVAESGYLQAAWAFGARPRGYSNSGGTVRRLEAAGDGGVWEIGVRASRAELGDVVDQTTASIERFRADSLGLAVNWTPRPDLRLMSQWLHSDFENGAQRTSGPSAQVRVQWAF